MVSRIIYFRPCRNGISLMDLCILLYFSLYIIIYSGRTNFLALSQLQPSPCNFKILTKNTQDESKFEENDSTKYDVERNLDGLRYNFKNGSKCVRLDYDNTPIWTYDPQINGEKYPVEIFFNSHTNSVRIKTENRLYIYSLRNGTWDLIFESEVTSVPQNTYQLFTPLRNDLTVYPTSEYSSLKYFDFENKSQFLGVSATDFVRKLSDSQIKIITVDDYLRFQVNDLTHFFITKFQNVTTYELVDLKMFCEVKYKNRLIWINKSNRVTNTYPDLINIFTDKDIICLDFSGRRVIKKQGIKFRRYINIGREFYRKSSNDRWDQKTMILHLTLKSDAGDGSEKTTELKLEHNFPGVLQHKFTDGEKCVKISSDILIWEHDPDINGDDYPIELYSDYWETRTIKIKFPRRSYLYKYESDKWLLKTLSIDDSSNHRMDNESIEPDGDKTVDNSEKSSDVSPTIEKSTEVTPAKEESDVTPTNEESTDVTQVSEESSSTVVTNEVSSDTTDENSVNESSKDATEESPKAEDSGEQSANESSTSPDSTESTSNESAESMPSQSTDATLGNESTSSHSTDLTSGDLTNNEANSQNGDGKSLFGSTVYP